eukprot:gene9129-1218_t
MTQQKKSLRSSKDIINRFKWDNSFDKDKLTIGYKDRFVGIMECNLETYDIGDIPEHRIYYFKYEGTTIWDRIEKLDKISFATSPDDFC